MQRPLTTALGWDLPPWLLDYGPVGFVLLEGVIAIRIHVHSHIGGELGMAVTLVVVTAALLVRHRIPVLTLAVTLGAALASGYGPIVVLPVLLALFTLAEYRSRRVALVGVVVAAPVFLGAPLLHGEQFGLPQVLSRLVAVALPVAAGLYIHTRAEYVQGLHERSARLERERELLAEQSVAAERVRIARELHDVVAHSVSLMVVQAQALAATDDQPERTDSLRLIADLGRDALSEMHRMLGVLRVGEPAAGEPERAPQPGVRELDKLIGRARDAGLDAHLEIRGSERELPAGVDLSAYRIVQEALTNVVRHAQARRAEVTLTYGSDAVEVAVCDDGVGMVTATANGSGSGHGLVGMRERVALFGGSFTAGAGDGGRGFRVHASLPLG
jgi:signal transduction histidine kinase